MKILVVADVVGRVGRRALEHFVPLYVQERHVDFVVANCENAAAGFGLTPKLVRQILAAGVDAVTTGNHVWAHKEIYKIADKEPRFLRPANYPPDVPGMGWRVLRAGNGVETAVVNLCGRVFMDALDCPFRGVDAILESVRPQARVVVIDFHAEATSEKVAFGQYVDGRASVVAGTHTHVQTADERILPQGTAYITDCGMTGAATSVIGMEPEAVLRRFVSRMPAKFEAAKGKGIFQGILAEVDENTGKALDIQRVDEPFRGQQ